MRITAALLATVLIAAAPAAPKPRISMAQAKAIALKAAPGKIAKAEYEKEGGGWRYSFDIQQKGHIQEIGVNAMNGRIVEDKNEGKVDHD
jgi:uncharacterized membrane protein YkoI